MVDPARVTRFRFWLWLIKLIGVIVPRRLREAAFRGQTDRSMDVCGVACVANRGGIAGLLFSGAAGNKNRPDGGAAPRMTL